MNKLKLKSVMVLHGDTNEDLAAYLGIAPQTLSCKISSKEINGRASEFTQSEIAAMKSRYNLSPDDLDTIFFALEVS